MSDEIIGMDDMMAVYRVTDEFGIDRESISVPLEKGPAVSASKQPDGSVEIVVPVVSTSREAAPAAVDLEVSFQACADQMCYIPRTERLRVEFRTAPGVRRAEAASG